MVFRLRYRDRTSGKLLGCEKGRATQVVFLISEFAEAKKAREGYYKRRVNIHSSNTVFLLSSLFGEELEEDTPYNQGTLGSL